MLNKRGDNILVQNIIFIVIIVVFTAILVLFVWRSASGESLVEESYSKTIALMIEAGKPGMRIEFDAEKLFETADSNNWNRGRAVIVENNRVYVQTREKGGKSYGFFNDVNVNILTDENKLILEINE